MSDPDVGTTTERQRGDRESDGRAAMRMLQFPLEQALEFQRQATRTLLGGLQMGERAQRQGLEVARNALDEYLDAVERTSDRMMRTTREAVESTAAAGETVARTGAGQPGTAGEPLDHQRGAPAPTPGYGGGAPTQFPRYRQGTAGGPPGDQTAPPQQATGYQGPPAGGPTGYGQGFRPGGGPAAASAPAQGQQPPTQSYGPGPAATGGVPDRQVQGGPAAVPPR